MTTDEKLDKIATELSEARITHRLAEREVTRAHEAIRKLEQEDNDAIARARAYKRLRTAEIDAKRKRIELNAAEEAFVNRGEG